jgi:hypothetical protein
VEAVCKYGIMMNHDTIINRNAGVVEKERPSRGRRERRSAQPKSLYYVNSRRDASGALGMSRHQLYHYHQRAQAPNSYFKQNSSLQKHCINLMAILAREYTATRNKCLTGREGLWC